MRMALLNNYKCSQSPSVDHQPDGKAKLIVKTMYCHVVCTAEVGPNFKSRLVGRKL